MSRVNKCITLDAAVVEALESVSRETRVPMSRIIEEGLYALLGMRRPARHCAECGRPFIPQHVRHVCCSERCTRARNVAASKAAYQRLDPCRVAGALGLTLKTAPPPLIAAKRAQLQLTRRLKGTL